MCTSEFYIAINTRVAQIFITLSAFILYLLPFYTSYNGDNNSCAMVFFELLENLEKSSYVLGSELRESKFDGLLSLVKEYIVDIWDIRKHKLYDSD